MPPRGRGDAGQAFPIYITVVAGLLFLAFAYLAVGQAAANRNGAQTAADAAALAAAQDTRDQLAELWKLDVKDPAKWWDIFHGIAAGLTPLAVILVMASLLSYFYYLRVVVVMYMQPAREAGEHHAARLPGPAMLGVGLSAALVVLLFFAGGWPMGWAQRSADSLWPAEWNTGGAAAAPAAPAPTLPGLEPQLGPPLAPR